MVKTSDHKEMPYKYHCGSRVNTDCEPSSAQLNRRFAGLCARWRDLNVFRCIRHSKPREQNTKISKSTASAQVMSGPGSSDNWRRCKPQTRNPKLVILWSSSWALVVVVATVVAAGGALWYAVVATCANEKEPRVVCSGNIEYTRGGGGRQQKSASPYGHRAHLCVDADSEANDDDMGFLLQSSPKRAAFQSRGRRINQVRAEGCCALCPGCGLKESAQCRGQSLDCSPVLALSLQIR